MEHSDEQGIKIIRIVLSFIIFISAILVDIDNVVVNNIMFLVSYIIIGYDIIFRALRNIFKGKLLDENFLMMIATIGAFAIGEYPEAVAVMLFYQVGEFFQDYAVDRSRKSIANLMDIRPDYANLVTNKASKRVEPNEVHIDDIILVKPGEKIPLDGIVIDGSSFIDTRALTGESVPRKVDIADEVLSGCINSNGTLKIRVIKEFGDSTASKILDLVENASSRKSKSENFISKFASIYTPIVVVSALLLAIIPPLFINDALFSDWLYRALSFLVVSCPCALVISIPLSFFSGIGAASKMGVLIKGSNYLEALSNVDTIVCDKTGTLTEGVFEVQKIYSIDKKVDILKYAAYSEYYSNHPISIALRDAYNKRIDEKRIGKIEEISGKGIKAIVDKKHILIGNDKLMEEFKIKYDICDDAGTIVYIAIDKKFMGYILISDKIKDDSYRAIEVFKKNNAKVIMLTGDHDGVSSKVAEELKLDDYYASLLPQNKVSKVEELLNECKGSLLFIGDGINDAPVLALADIGVAMGALGSDAAIEAADIVIMTDEPSKVASSIDLSKRTMRIVKENIIIAIAIKVSILILSALGIATMWYAVFADVGVSIMAVLNSLRVLRVKR